jgi:hypothetical protein
MKSNLMIKNSKLIPTLGAIVFLCLLFFLFRKPLLILSYRIDYRRSANAFWNSMRVNDEYTAKQITDPTQWPRIDEWKYKQQISECDFSQAPYGPQSGLRQINSDLWDISTSHFCEGKNGMTYSFSIEGMKVKRTGYVWLIVDWEDIAWTRLP